MKVVAARHLANIIAAAAALTLTGGCSPSVRYTRDQQPSSQPAQTQQRPPLSAARIHRGASQDKLVQVAESYLGTPYRYGGMSRNGIDCSAFTLLVYREVYGIELPRSSAKMWKKGKAVPLRAARPGDLCFFRSRGKRGKIDHVGIYMGNNRFIHASTSSGVIYSDLSETYFSERFAGIRRFF